MVRPDSWLKKRAENEFGRMLAKRFVAHYSPYAPASSSGKASAQRRTQQSRSKSPRRPNAKKVKATKSGLRSSGRMAYDKGYLGGKVRKGKSIRNSFNKYLSQGVLGTTETGLVQTADYSAYLGHTTYVKDEYRRFLFLALLKALMKKHNYPFINIQDSMGLTANTSFVIEYAIDAEAAALHVTYTVGATTDTWLQVANVFVAYFDAQPVGQEFYLRRMQMSSPAGVEYFSSIMLNDATVGIEVKSSLKMQNRSVNTADNDQSDDVDSVPIYGKTYEGSGNGMQLKRDSAISRVSFFGTDISGIIAVTPSLSEVNLREPGLPSAWINVKKANSLAIQPGQIKSSVLQWQVKHMNLQRLMRILFDPTNKSITKNAVEIGKFRVYGYERIVVAESGKLTTVLAAEHNLRLGMIVYPKSITRGNEMFTQAFIV